MPKNKLKVSLNNDLIIVDYIINENVIEYKEKDGTRVTYNLDKNILIRDNNDLNMIYDFNNKKGNILIKELASELEISINNIEIERIDNNVVVKFSIEEENYTYSLEVL